MPIGPVKLLGTGKKEAEMKSLDFLKLVGLAEKAGNYPDELSGGQEQRVALHVSWPWNRISSCSTSRPPRWIRPW